MIGLLVKDFTVLKKQCKITLLVLLLYAFWSYSEKDATMFAYMSVLFGFFLPLTAITFDERSEWNKYALCMPIEKSYIAIEKYILGFLSLLMCTIIYYILTLLINSNISVDQLKVGLTMLSIGLGLVSFYLPVCFKFGADKARYVILIIALVPTLLTLALSKTSMLPEISNETIQLLINLAPLVSLVLLLASCALSVHIVKHKEY